MPDTHTALWPVLLQLLLIFLNAVFACAEIAVISMNDNKLAKLTNMGDKRAVRLTRLTSQPAKFLATIQVGITLAGFMGSAFAANNFAGDFEKLLVKLGAKASTSTLDAVSVIVITIIMAFITLVFGELVPKRIAMKHAERLALAMSGFISGISKIFAPLVWFLTIATNGILRLMGIDPHAADNSVTEEEILMMVDAGSEKGAIAAIEKDMIQNIFEFNDTAVSEIMTHRTDVAVLWMDETPEQWDETIHESRHSVYPVCNESVDDIVGVLYAKDYFRLHDKSRESVMRDAVRSAWFVSETIRADSLFRNMKKNRNHFAVVIDEYGGMSGIVTMNDLLECLVGELEDDYSAPEEEPLIEKVDETTWKIRGAAPVEDVADQLGIELPEDCGDTFGGFVFGLLGTIPEDGATPALEEYGLNIKVTDVHDRRLETAIVQIVPKEEEDEE